MEEGQRPPLTRHARWVLGSSTALIVAGAAIFGIAERTGALVELDSGRAVMAALFQSITLRTAGFNTVPLAGLGLSTVALCITWMLVGGSPMGTAGGVKTTSVLAAWSSWTGRPRVDGPPHGVPRGCFSPSSPRTS